MREKDIEKALVKKIDLHKGVCWKFTSPGTAGVPDRIILMKGGRIAFAEIKAPGQQMRPLQIRRKQQLEQLGFKVFCIDSKESIDALISKVANTDGRGDVK